MRMTTIVTTTTNSTNVNPRVERNVLVLDLFLKTKLIELAFESGSDLVRHLWNIRRNRRSSSDQSRFHRFFKTASLIRVTQVSVLQPLVK